MADDPFGLGPQGTRVLQVLARQPYVSSSEIALELDVNIRRVLPVVRDLAARGLVRSGEADDRMAWALTDAGWDLVREIRRASRRRGPLRLLRRLRP